MNDIDLDYLREKLTAANFWPFQWEGEDRNLLAFRSQCQFIQWYCQPPGGVGQPYRDRGFYCRELAYLSRVVQPRTVVELGTSLGIGTCLLHWLNPEAKLVTVDRNVETFMPGDQRVPMGFLARHQQIPCEYLMMDSWAYRQPYGVDLCFIDADHTYWPVLKDSNRAWENRSRDHRWAIVWHDYNDRHPGVMSAVEDFCRPHEVALNTRYDSDTVWIIGE